MNTQKTVIIEKDTAIMAFDDYMNGWRAVCEIRQFIEDNWNTGDLEFQAEVFKAAADYVCRCFPCNSPVDIDSEGNQMETLKPVSGGEA